MCWSYSKDANEIYATVNLHGVASRASSFPATFVLICATTIDVGNGQLPLIFPLVKDFEGSDISLPADFIELVELESTVLWKYKHHTAKTCTTVIVPPEQAPACTDSPERPLPPLKCVHLTRFRTSQNEPKRL
jgi:hypothetical protein